MAVRTPGDLVAYLLARLPLLLLFAGVCWVLFAGLAQLEMFSFGTEVFVGNDETTNRLPSIGGSSDEDLLLDAYNSGDTAQMERALDTYEARNAG